MTTCYECAKIIKGTMHLVVPSNLAIALGDFQKAYHPRCYVKAEKAATRGEGGIT
jgi:hypothetical protein